MNARGFTEVVERGESLIELIIAITIMGIAVVAITAGIGTGIAMSDIHRKQSTAGVVVRSYAESILAHVAASSSAYTGCATSYSAPGFVSPAGYSASITGISYWKDSSRTFASSCGTDEGVQRVSLRVSSSDGRSSESLDVIVRKPCRAGDPSC